MLAWPHSGFSLKKLSYDGEKGVVRYRPGKEGRAHDLHLGPAPAGSGAPDHA